MTRCCALLVIFLWLAVHPLYCQDTSHAREVIRDLCDQKMKGRGYVQNGDRKAADYIRHRLEDDGIRPLGTLFFQSFPININTFPGAMKLSINNRQLLPGRDFIVDPASPGIHGSFIPLYVEASDLLKGLSDDILKSLGNKVVIVDTRRMTAEKAEIKKVWNEWRNLLRFGNPYKIKALIEISEEKLVFGAATQLSVIPYIIITGAFHDPVTSLDIHIKNSYLEGYRTQNVVGYIPGTVCPDSFLVYTAHYDHLGTMGRNTFYPGANDNASGTAMMLGLARHFSMYPQRYSIAFIGFSGEEAGLLGSRYFINNPLIRLSHIKFMVNLDLVGTGVDGITVVNATEFPSRFELFRQLNDSGGYLPNIKKRGKACNSDHCPFFEKGVPCFFIYTLGGIAAYHDPDDRPETLPLTAFEGLTKLLIAFGEKQ